MFFIIFSSVIFQCCQPENQLKKYWKMTQAKIGEPAICQCCKMSMMHYNPLVRRPPWLYASSVKNKTCYICYIFLFFFRNCKCRQTSFNGLLVVILWCSRYASVVACFSSRGKNNVKLNELNNCNLTEKNDL